jgi:hypothetical protein
MAQPRSELHELLTQLADNVYFQPPAGYLMKFPCITYSRDGVLSKHADNELYQHAKRYQVTVIDRDPDTELAEKIENLQYCAFERFFAQDDLNHYVYTLFF